MASAIIGGLVRQGLATGGDARGRRRRRRRRARLERAIRHQRRRPPSADAGRRRRLHRARRQAAADARGRAAPRAARSTDQLVISIAAGIRGAISSRWLGGHPRIVRAMPNTPALVAAGITGLYAMPGRQQRDRAQARKACWAPSARRFWVEQEERSRCGHRGVRQRPRLCVLFHRSAASRPPVDLGLPPATRGRVGAGHVRRRGQARRCRQRR